MWHKKLDNNKFISNLYSEVPPLIDVRIVEMKIIEEGNRVTISFDMPCFPDNPPKKWINLGYNTVNVKLDLFHIYEIEMKSNQMFYKGSIEISKDKDVKVKITGKIDVEIRASVGLIQSIEGYINRY